MARSFKVLDRMFDQEKCFGSETEANKWIYWRRAQILSEYRQAFPGQTSILVATELPGDRTEYKIWVNDEDYGLLLVKWPTY